MTTAGFAPGRLTADERTRRWRHDRAFFGFVTLAAALVVFAGFARSYYLRPFTDAPGFPPIVELHAALFSSWMVLFAVQASLVTARRTDLHRRLGVLGIGLAIALLVTGYLTAVTGARTGWAGPLVPRDAAAALPFLTIPFGDLMLFAGFFSAAVYWRRQPEPHKRLMTLAMIGGIMPAAFGRLPVVVSLAAAIALLLAGPLYDRWSRGSVHRAYAWGIPIIIASFPLRFAVGSTDAWRRAAQWFIQ
jgi:hypothetical protein